MGVREQLVGVDSFLSPCVSWRIDLRLSGLMVNAFTHWTVLLFLNINYSFVVIRFFFKFSLSQGLSTYSWLSWNSYVGRPDWSRSLSVPPTSASRVLGLKVCTTATFSNVILYCCSFLFTFSGASLGTWDAHCSQYQVLLFLDALHDWNWRINMNTHICPPCFILFFVTNLSHVLNILFI